MTVTMMLLAVLSAVLCLHVRGDRAVEITFRNELPIPVEVIWEHPSLDERPPPPGVAVPAFGGETKVRSYEDHTFSYLFEESKHYVRVPRDADGAPLVLNADREDIRVRCASTVDGGMEPHVTFDILVKPQWSPHGAVRFLDLVRDGYFDGVALNRVVPRFLTQFGISRDVEKRTHWKSLSIPDDVPTDPKIPFHPGMFSYAGSGPNSRTTEIFVVMPETPQGQLDYFGINPWETPFAVLDGDVSDGPVPRWYSYGDMAPWGEGPDPQKIYPENGYEYLEREFPSMDYISSCYVVEDLDAEVERDL